MKRLLWLLLILVSPAAFAQSAAFNLSQLAHMLDPGGIVPCAAGGTGITGTPANGQILIGNGVCWTPATITGGSNVTITNGVGTITISSSGGGTPGGNSGQLQANQSGAFAGFDLGGDCTFSYPNITCSTAGGVPIVTTTGTQTLTNKSIAGSEINSGTVGASFLPAALSSSNSINGSAIPATAGTLNANGASWSMAAGFTGSYGSGHLNADQLLGDQLPSLASGFLEWNGSAWVFGSPTAAPCGSSGNLQYNNSGSCGGATLGAGLSLSGGTLSTTASTRTAASPTVASTDMGGQINVSSGTITIPAISSTVFAAGMSLSLVNYSGSTETVSTTPTVNAGGGCVSGTGIPSGDSWQILSNGTTLDCIQTIASVGTVALTSLASQAANTIVANATGSAAVPTAVAVNSTALAILKNTTAVTLSSCTPSASTLGPKGGIFTQPATPCTTVTVTFAVSVPDGWMCDAEDRTLQAAGTWWGQWGESSSTATTCVVAIPTAAQTTGDVIRVKGDWY